VICSGWKADVSKKRDLVFVEAVDFRICLDSKNMIPACPCEDMAETRCLGAADS